jgi:hypothetical protein
MLLLSGPLRLTIVAWRGAWLKQIGSDKMGCRNQFFSQAIYIPELEQLVSKYPGCKISYSIAAQAPE